MLLLRLVFVNVDVMGEFRYLAALQVTGIVALPRRVRQIQQRLRPLLYPALFVVLEVDFAARFALR